jgi:hypothetical protein
MSSPWSPSSKLILAAVALFLALSVADFFLTWQLIDTNPGQVSESNPIAAAVLHAQGWYGLAAYKLVVVAMVGGLAWLIYRSRPRLAEMVMVFGCGALAAVVLTSYFHLRSADAEPVTEVICLGPASNADALPSGALTVLARESVQAELKLSEEQIGDVQKAAHLRRELRQRLRFGKLESCKVILTILSEVEARLAVEMTPHQAQRLKQLTWQHRGFLALVDVEVAVALQLNAAQLDEIIDLIDPRDPAEWGTGQGPVSVRRDDADLKRQLAAILRPEQHARWHEIVGEPFSFVTNRAADVQATDSSEE